MITKEGNNIRYEICVDRQALLIRGFDFEQLKEISSQNTRDEWRGKWLSERILVMQIEKYTK